MATYDGLEFDITADSSKAIESINRLKKALDSMQSAVEKADIRKTASSFSRSLKSISNALTKFSNIDVNTKKLNSLTHNFAKLSETMKSLEGGVDTDGIKSFKSSISSVANALKRLENIPENDYSTLASNIENLKKALSGFDSDTIKKMKEIAPSMYLISKAQSFKVPKSIQPQEEKPQEVDYSKYSDMARTFASSSLQGSVQAFKKMSDFAKEAYSNVGKLAGAVGNKLFGGISQAVNKFNELKSAIGRIALYRALRTVIKDATAGIQEGMENAYYWATLTGNKFASSMDQIATAAQYAKNSMGAMAAPIFNALAPVIDALIDKFVALVNIINQVFSILGGSGKWIKAIKYPTSYASALGNTGSAAKDAKKQVDLFLASFDELHLTEKSDSGSSGGGGGSGGGGKSYGSMFEYADVSDDVKKWMNTDDWTELGQIIGEKLNVITKQMDDWINNTFRPFLKLWAKRIATLLNGIMDTYDFEMLGKLLADGLNALIDGANTFLEIFRSYTFGKSIGEVINGWFKYIEWENIARYFRNKLKTFVNIAQGFVDELLPQAFENGYKIGETVRGIFDSIDWTQIRKTLSTGLGTIADFMEGFFSGEDGSFDRFAVELATTLKGVLSNPDTNTIIEGVANCINAIITAFNDPSLWYSVGETIGKCLGAIDWNTALQVFIDAIGGTIVGLFNGLFEEDHGTAFVGIVGAIGLLKGAFDLAKVTVLKSALETFGKTIAEKLIGHITTNVSESVAEGVLADGIGTSLSTGLGGIASTIISALPTLGYIGIGAGIVAAIGAGFSEMAQPTYQEKLAEIDTLQDTFYKQYGMNETQYMQKYGASALQEAYNKLTGIETDYFDSSRENSTSWLTDTTGTFSDMSNQVNSTMTSAYSSMKSTTSSANSTMSSDTKTKWDQVKQNIGSATNSIKNNVQTAFSNIGSKISDSWSGVKTKTNEVWNTVKSNLSSSWDSIKNTATSKFNSIKDSITSPLSKAKDTIKNIVDTIKGFFSNFSVSIPHIKLPHFSVRPSGWQLGDLLKGSIPSLSISWYAQGGFPDDGQLFVAREAGAEMVGSINGHTAVANNDQIVAAVSQGVYSAVVSAMNGGNSNNINLTVTLDGETVYKNVVKHNNQKVVQTGSSPLMV